SAVATGAQDFTGSAHRSLLLQSYARWSAHSVRTCDPVLLRVFEEDAGWTEVECSAFKTPNTHLGASSGQRIGRPREARRGVLARAAGPASPPSGGSKPEWGQRQATGSQRADRGDGGERGPRGPGRGRVRRQRGPWTGDCSGTGRGGRRRGDREPQRRCHQARRERGRRQHGPPGAGRFGP